MTTTDLREKLRNTYLDYGNDLLVSGGSLETHVDEAMSLVESYSKEMLVRYEDWLIENAYGTTFSSFDEEERITVGTLQMIEGRRQVMDSLTPDTKKGGGRC